MINKKKRFDRLCEDIKSIKIQGARNVAIAGLKAYKLFPTEESKRKIASLRPTEPFLINVLRTAEGLTISSFNQALKKNQDIINKEVHKLIKNNDLIFTHCHSSTVVSSLIYSKRKGKKFEVYLTETRPLYQGRKTAKELKAARIKVTMFVDAAAAIALTHEQGTRKADLVLFGADAITKKGTINKVGSGMFAQIARLNNIPVYILADSMKHIRKIKLEKRSSDEVWHNQKIQIDNFAFELIKRKYITGVISEFGLLPYMQFIKKSKKKIKLLSGPH
jgi:translation initiation factor 2B subunit (eIF-2B alpha/beta/delta family)